MRRISKVVLALIASAVPAAAFGYRPVVRPWSPTAERFVRSTVERPEGATSTHSRRLGLTPLAFRVNGAPAVLTASAPRAGGTAIAPDRAERLARQLVVELAPELKISPAALVHAGTHGAGDLITVAYRQTHDGVPIHGARLALSFRGETLALAVNDLAYVELDTRPAISAEAAAAIALDAARAYASDAALASAPEREVWLGARDEAHLAWAVRTRSQRPRSEVLLHVDAITGAILAGDDDVRFADGEGRVRFLVDEVHTDSPEVPFTIPYLTLASGVATDSDGEALRAAPVQVSYTGPLADVRDQSGAAVESLALGFGGPFAIYDATPQSLSQADPFVHTLVVKRWAKPLTPSMTWLDQRLRVNVNINDTCNAFWDGSTVNFFRAGGECSNTGRVASVVYHEFGHGYHQHLTDNVVGSVGEGTGDYIAATILDTPLMGVGFFTSGQPMRRLDRAWKFPDDYVNEVHQDGLIWASAMWDLRSAMITKHGRWAGVRLADQLFVTALGQGPRLGTSYVAVLNADDDDNSLANGTPNSCEINAVFDVHGLVNSGQITNNVAPTRAFVDIRHDPPGRLLAAAAGGVELVAEPTNVSSCGSFSAQELVLHWSKDGTWQTVPVTVAGAVATAQVADLSEGEVFEYWWELPQANGPAFTSGTRTSPHVGYVARAGEVDITREGFEEGLGAWSHGTIAGDLTDDWEVGPPAGLALDPFAAKAGMNAAGTDLGTGYSRGSTDGAAKAGRSTFLESPPLPSAGMEEVRLELWHHHAVEGTLRILVGGTEVWTHAGAPSSGWRFLSIPLGTSARDNATGVVVRFEVETAAGNTLGGWTVDEVALTGIAIPPPPPPPEDPPPQDPPPKEPPIDVPPADPNDPMPPGSIPVDPTEPPSVDPTDPRPAGYITSGCACRCTKESSSASVLLLALGALLLLSGGRRRGGSGRARCVR